MDVILLENAVVGGVVYRVGERAVVDDDHARTLIAMGKASPAPVVVEVDSVEQVPGCKFT